MTEDINENHLLDIVDEDNNIISTATKEEKFEKELISRNVSVFLRDKNNYYVFVKRSKNKKSFPGRIDIIVAGHVNHGESYKDAVNREMEEEIGFIPKVKLLGVIYQEFLDANNKKSRYFTGVFLGQINRELKINHREFKMYKKMGIKELQIMINRTSDMFCPFLINEYKILKKYL